MSNSQSEPVIIDGGPTNSPFMVRRDGGVDPTTSAGSGNLRMDKASRLLSDEARAAWVVIGSGVGWDKWLAVGLGLEECRRLALERASANDMKSPKAKKEMAKVLEAEQLDRIDKGDRSVLLPVIADLPAITAWRDKLTTTERMRFNRPQVLMRRFKKATTMSPPKPENGGEPPEPRGYKAQYQIAETQISALKQRLKTQGSLFNLHTDTPDEIAAAVVGNVLASRAERIARAVLKLVAERKQNGHAG